FYSAYPVTHADIEGQGVVHMSTLVVDLDSQHYRSRLAIVANLATAKPAFGLGVRIESERKPWCARRKCVCVRIGPPIPNIGAAIGSRPAQRCHHDRLVLQRPTIRVKRPAQVRRADEAR